MKLLQNIILLNILFQSADCLFIRSNAVYSSIIKHMYDYYHCRSITILYADSNSSKIKEIESNTRLMNLQLNFSKLFILTSVMNVQTFTKEIGNVKDRSNSLIVLLNDSEDMKYHVEKLINQWSYLSTFIWLMFFDDKTELENYFKNIYIPFNAQFMVSKRNDTSQYSEIIFEIFKIDKKSQLFHNIFATWNSETDVQFPKFGLNYRRNQLYGLNLRTAVIHTLPTMSVAQKNGQIEVGGMFGETVDILKVAMNFTVTYIITDQFGKVVNNKWSGGVGLLTRNKLDFFPAYLGITSSRIGVIDYTKPLFLSTDRFFYSKPPRSLKWNSFLKPFSNGIWITILLFIPLISIVLTILEFMNQNPHGKFSKRIIFMAIIKNMVFAANAFCGKTVPRSKVDSIAILQSVLYLAVVVLLAAYSGIFISSLTNDNDIPQFKTMKDFNDKSTYTMGLLEGSTYLHLFENSTDKVMKQLVGRTIQRNALTTSNEQGFKRACSDPTYAFYTTDIARYFFNPKDCILLASKPIMKLSVSFGMQYHSPYKNIMDYYITSLRSSGIMKRILIKWAEYKIQPNKKSWEPVGLIDIAAFVIYFHIFVILSVFILWGEIINYRRYKQRKLATVFQRLITDTKYPMDDNLVIPVK